LEPDGPACWSTSEASCGVVANGATSGNTVLVPTDEPDS
jgi:hypothetical protein